MAKLKGQFAEIKVDVSGTPTKAAGLINWKISIKSEKIDTTAAGDTWKNHETGLMEWEAEAEVNEVDTFWYTKLTGGAKVNVTFYTAASSTTGTVYYSGSATLEGDIEAPYDGLVGASIKMTGSGSLTKNTV